MRTKRTKHAPIAEAQSNRMKIHVPPAKNLFMQASLPFTIPTGSVDGAAEMLIVKPFKFSFTRKPNDQDMYQDIY